MDTVKIGGIYKHFKGKEYRVLALARDCEDPQRQLVIYQAQYESEFGKNQVWTRELNDFLGYKENPDGTRVKRFTLVG